MRNGVLIPGQTCWRIAHADKVAVIRDAATYFTQVKRAILAARHSVLLIGWDFDTRIILDRDDPEPGIPNTLGDLLNYVVRHNKGLHVYVLRWDLAFLEVPLRGTTPLFLLNWLANPRLHFKLDGHHPDEACHHQKIAVIDDALAFCGGIDITLNRWDTPRHLDHDPRRTHPDGTPHGPWHDVTTAVHGDAARALGDLARKRWYLATEQRIEPPPPGQTRWPDNLDAQFQDLDVAIARTEPAYGEQREAHEIEALYLAAIAAAERTIYLESQYFSGHRIAHAIMARLAEPHGPEIVIVNPRRAEGFLEEEAMGSARAILLERCRAADRHHRLRFYTPVTEERHDIYVHAKVLVIDDQLLRVGSSNINNRSMGLDTECDLAIEAQPHQTPTRRAILEVRDALVAEHLGISRATLDQTLQAHDGSLTQTLDQLIRPTGRSLESFTPPKLTPTERRLGETHALDPSHPEPIDKTLLETLRVITPKWALIPAAALAALAAALRLDTRRSKRRF